ncbi:hypothetical protein NIES25_35210 [Nostoc linckia NIES-25]|nr:hypothetical protein NIES25_35210 [Nostoc linckia NIES-25]
MPTTSFGPKVQQKASLLIDALSDYYSETTEKGNQADNPYISIKLQKDEGVFWKNNFFIINIPPKKISDLLDIFLLSQINKNTFDRLSNQSRYELIKKDLLNFRNNHNNKIKSPFIDADGIRYLLAELCNKGFLEKNGSNTNHNVYCLESNGKLEKLQEVFENSIRRYSTQPTMQSYPKKNLVSSPGNSDEFGIHEQFWSVLEKHKNFISRDYVIKDFNDFCNDYDSGYFIIQGEPGIGKTAILVNYANNNKHPCFFVQSEQGLNRSEDFFESICTQIIKKYPHVLSTYKNETKDAKLFNSLLGSLSKNSELEINSLIICIDALDEAEPDPFFEENILKLPENLPKNVFFFITQRANNFNWEIQVDFKVTELSLLIESHWRKEFEEYIKEKIPQKIRDGISNWCIKSKLNQEILIRVLINKSESNFRYFKNMLDDIGRGLYEDSKLEDLPKGLNNYYKDHCRQMMKSKSLKENKLKKLLFWNIVNKKEITLGNFQSAMHSELQSILNDWTPFLQKEKREKHYYYTLYHQSFGKFIQENEEIKAYCEINE